MPDREAAPRRRRRGSSSPNPAHTPALGVTHDSYAPYDFAPHDPRALHDALERQRRAGAHRMGIPRILGRRARWVGARLRREG
ncbi:hypothetical protein [Kitasatospora sp. MMS16-BH015]|uniref:hypothetical protein n=1 Tax=Kitasatospora sp. MMS16-BH015 TaxID=2018025 RepID=UPI00131A5470|nr:hypothetical protein [Kitasatospora sp. MMS16-BH015]